MLPRSHRRIAAVLAFGLMCAPALAQAGLSPERVIHVEAGEERDALFAAEEGLRHGGLAGVAVELSRLSLTVSRRLQLAAETSGALCLVVRRWRRPAWR